MKRIMKNFLFGPALILVLVGAGCTQPTADVQTSAFMIHGLSTTVQIHETEGYYQNFVTDDPHYVMSDGDYRVNYAVGSSADPGTFFQHSVEKQVVLDGQQLQVGPVVGTGEPKYKEGYYRPVTNDSAPQIFFVLSANTEEGLAAAETSLQGLTWR